MSLVLLGAKSMLSIEAQPSVKSSPQPLPKREAGRVTDFIAQPLLSALPPEVSFIFGGKTYPRRLESCSVAARSWSNASTLLWRQSLNVYQVASLVRTVCCGNVHLHLAVTLLFVTDRCNLERHSHTVEALP